MVGVCKQVFVQLCCDCVWSVVGDYGVNQVVVVWLGDFVVGEVQLFLVVVVVSQVEVYIECLVFYCMGFC